MNQPIRSLTLARVHDVISESKIGSLSEPSYFIICMETVVKMLLFSFFSPRTISHLSHQRGSRRGRSTAESVLHSDTAPAVDGEAHALNEPRHEDTVTHVLVELFKINKLNLSL